MNKQWRFYSSLPEIKYFVNRTALGKMLPVYKEKRQFGTESVTVIKKIDGDCTVLAEELECILKIPKPLMSVKKEFRRIVIAGDKKKEVVDYLYQKGF